MVRMYVMLCGRQTGIKTSGGLMWVTFPDLFGSVSSTSNRPPPSVPYRAARYCLKA